MKPLPALLALGLVATGLLAFAPAADARSCQVVLLSPPGGVVCTGIHWCGDYVCGTEACVADLVATGPLVCVLRDEVLSDGCAFYAVDDLGVACFDGTQVCATSSRIFCLF
jgi:hypothetical protein